MNSTLQYIHGLARVPLHKLLEHGPDNEKEFPMPIAIFTENGVEIMPNIHSATILEHSTKSSRDDTILDTFNSASYLFNPIISMVYLDRRLEMH